MIPLREEKPKKTRPENADIEFEIAFFEGVVRRDPNFIEALQILGDAYTKSGQFEKGLKIDQRLRQLCPEDPLVWYNLACSYALLNKLDQAFAALEKAIQLGYTDANWMEKDPDLNSLRADPRYAQIKDALTKKS
jgi:tetratricopeptide (TPR) repeat protein